MKVTPQAALGVTAVVAALLAAPLSSPAHGAIDEPEVTRAEQVALDAGLSVAPKAAFGTRPKGVNPYLATVEDESEVDYAGWANYLRAQSDQRQRRLSGTRTVTEGEAADRHGANETPASAQRITGFDSAVRIAGSLSNEPAEPAGRPATAEDDGSITLAGDTGIGGGTRSVKVSATIGDGPHASTGDFDFYRVDVKAGQTLTVDVDTPEGSGLDSVAVVYTQAGAVVASNDDDAQGLDSQLSVPAENDVTYSVLIASSGNLPADPLDPASGDGAVTTGDYDVTITAAVTDTDVYAVPLRAGDVLGASVSGSAGWISVYDTLPQLVQGSGQDTGELHPDDSPLPSGGNASAEHVATTTGWHYVAVTRGSGDYDLQVEAYRPELENSPPTQTLFLDFDGAEVNTAAVWGDLGAGDGFEKAQLSPFSSFLGGWGLTADDEPALIDAITASATENLEHDLAASGLNRNFRLKIVNSKDSPDLWGGKNVSRVIVGGTQAEAGLATIGIAQSIDPGNFATQETALVMQDRYSAPAGPAASLNTYLTADSDKIAFLGQAIGNVVAHEAGHFFGNRHTDNSDDRPNIEDSGGAHYDTKFGVGPDGVGGTADDTDLDFGPDAYAPSEGFTGTQNTLGRIVFALTR
ncbi:PPC domain-containing protein [Kineosporia succinea]|uniref:Peptidase C-terminal archaeal/bacterial domain-containing protein n=1 Tax=Kineosporia succinea TaxID=84632 RepID=A0ABT9PDY0_9ACTN|nr:PPC domain-containing protein [Kineosporia succinea]MDP9830907.1 hypothetical protein [Kineosporia succinea]